MSNDLKERIIKEVDAVKDEIIEINDYLYKNPELGYQEFKASKLLTSKLEEAGFEVQKGICGMETAFKAEFKGKGSGPKVALLAEYDALPEPVGHGCQHNLIGAISVGTGLALSRVMSELNGSLYVFGCPAEEGVVDNAGGKVPMIDEFKEMDTAMMIHGAQFNTDGSENVLNLNREALEITFLGKAASAAQAEFASEGINALEACMLFWQALNAYRLQMKDGARVYGIITEGGTAVNVIPERAVTRILIRVEDYPYFLELVEKVKTMAEGAAMALGAKVEIRSTANRYLSFNPNQNLATAYGKNAESLGLPLFKVPAGIGGGASDMGNVSRVCPAIHPFVASMPKGTPNHTADAADASVSELGHKMAVLGAKALGMTAVDVLTGVIDTEVMRKEFEETTAKMLNNGS
ncbi:amidohydrolase [Desulfitispora alkaliphila]|uniref:amidohydrolase n=1 Tax=Desulfitispora alkaliphila TaxID=622674 RepID=UPI003D255C2A